MSKKAHVHVSTHKGQDKSVENLLNTRKWLESSQKTFPSIGPFQFQKKNPN